MPRLLCHVCVNVQSSGHLLSKDIFALHQRYPWQVLLYYNMLSFIDVICLCRLLVDHLAIDTSLCSRDGL